MAEYFPQGTKRKFPYKVVVPCTRTGQGWRNARALATHRAAQQAGSDPDLASFLENANGEELGGRYKHAQIRRAPQNKSHLYEVHFFFSNDKAAIAFKMRFA